MKQKKALLSLMLVLALLFSFGAINSQAAASNVKVAVSPDTNYVGQAVTINASATGTNLKYKYVWSYNNWKEWKVIKDFSSETTAAFTPSKPGKYTVYVDVKDSTNKVTTVTKDITVSHGWQSKINVTSENIVGTPIEIKGTSTIKSGINPDLKYKIVYERDNWKEWRVLSDFSTKDSVIFTPTKAGTYTFYIDAKDKYGNIVTVKSSHKINMYTAALEITGKRSVGSTVSLKAQTKYPSNYTYKFVWQKDNWKQWGVIKDFDANSSTTFVPEAPGMYTFYVDVKDKYGNIVYKEQDVQVSSGWTSNIKVTHSSTYIGTQIYISANTNIVNADIPSLSNKFVWMRDNWAEWGIIEDYSEKSSVIFTPEKPGNYEFYLDTKDPFGNIKTTTSSCKVILGWIPTTSASSNGNRVGSTITAAAQVEDRSAKNSFTYKFVWSKNNWAEWGVIEDFSAKNSINYTPKNNGQYDIYVDIKDKYGNILTQTKSFNIITDWTANTPTVSMSGHNPGSKITITANPSKSISGLKYKFVWMRDNWAEWGVIQNFDTSKSNSFTATKPGNYTVYTDIKDANGSINTASRSFTIRPKAYKLVVNLSTQTVSALVQNADGSYGASVRNFPCSTGKSAGATPSGTFPLKTKYRWHTLMGGVKGQWCSRIVNGILFHSVPYRSASNMSLITKYYNQLGNPASAGCVRLAAVDAKWIYDNCPEGTPVQIGHFNWPNLPGKVYARRIKSSTTWDPTDPSLGSAYYNKGWQ